MPIKAQRHHRTHPKWCDSKGLARVPEGLPKLALVHRVAVDLIAKVACIADALHGAIDLTNRHADDVEEFHGADVIAGAQRQKLAGFWPCDLETGAPVRHISHTNIAL